MEGDRVVRQDVFLFRMKGVDKKGNVIGNFVPQGLVPKFAYRFKELGIKMPKGLFGT